MGKAADISLSHLTLFSALSAGAVGLGRFLVTLVVELIFFMFLGFGTDILKNSVPDTLQIN